MWDIGGGYTKHWLWGSGGRERRDKASFWKGGEKERERKQKNEWERKGHGQKERRKESNYRDFFFNQKKRGQLPKEWSYSKYFSLETASSQADWKNMKRQTQMCAEYMTQVLGHNRNSRKETITWLKKCVNQSIEILHLLRWWPLFLPLWISTPNLAVPHYCQRMQPPYHSQPFCG